MLGETYFLPQRSIWMLTLLLPGPTLPLCLPVENVWSQQLWTILSSCLVNIHKILQMSFPLQLTLQEDRWRTMVPIWLKFSATT